MRNLTYPCLLILSEKHGPRYFLITDKVKLLKICLFIVHKRRNEIGYYEDITDDENEAQRPLYVKVMTELDGEAAYKLLTIRKNYEYEGFEIESFEEVE